MDLLDDVPDDFDDLDDLDDGAASDGVGAFGTAGPALAGGGGTEHDFGGGFHDDLYGSDEARLHADRGGRDDDEVGDTGNPYDIDPDDVAADDDLDFTGDGQVDQHDLH